MSTNLTSVFLGCAIIWVKRNRQFFLEIQPAAYGGHFSLSSEIASSGTVLPMQLTMVTIFTMLNIISAPYVLFNVQTVFMHEQVIRYSGLTSAVIEIQLRYLIVMVNEDVLNRIRWRRNRSLENDANNMETMFSESQITRYRGNTTVF